MSDEWLRRLAAFLGVGSVAFGVAPAVWPGPFAWLFGLPRDEPVVLALTRSIGVRDAMIGAGLWSAAAHRGKYRPWLMARAVSDTADTLAVALAVRAGHRNPRFVVLGCVAAAAAVYGLGLLSAVWAAERRTAQADGA